MARAVAGLAAGACRWRDERACGDQSALANEPGGMQQANTALMTVRNAAVCVCHPLETADAAGAADAGGRASVGRSPLSL